MKLHTNPLYFLFVLVVRGSASAIFKAICVSAITKKQVKLKKAKMNFLFITIPSVALFLLKITAKNYIDILNYWIDFSLYEAKVIHFFIMFMVISRCVRAFVKILKNMMKVEKSKKKRQLKAMVPIYLPRE